MSDPTTPEGRAKLRELLAKATPGPWDWEEGEGELRVAAGDALTQWIERTTEDGHAYRIGTPPHSWKSTNLIYEHELDTWDEGEDQDDDQRRADAELIVAAVNALPALLDALDRTQSGGRTLGRIVDRLHHEMLDATGAHDLIGEDGDGDWQLVSELLQELRPARDAALARAAKAEATLARVRALAAEWDTLPCVCGYRIPNGNDDSSQCLSCAAEDLRTSLDGPQ